MDAKSQDQVGVLIKLLGSVAGIALTFYLIGFTVVQSYFYGNQLEGFFFLSRDFYEAAGVTFLIEMIRAPLWSPLIVGPYLFLLIWLIPKPKDVMNADAGFGRKLLLTRSGILLAILVATYAYCLFYNRIADIDRFLPSINALVWSPSASVEPSSVKAFGFFALASPMVFAGMVLLWRFRALGATEAPVGYSYKAAAYFFIAYLAMLPIAYGFHIYDWKIVLVNDPASIKGLLSTRDQDSRLPSVWLIGKFGERFVFVKRGDQTELAVIATLEDDDVNQLSLETNEVNYLKVVLERDKPRESNVMDLIQQFENSGYEQTKETE